MPGSVASSCIDHLDPRTASTSWWAHPGGYASPWPRNAISPDVYFIFPHIIPISSTSIRWLFYLGTRCWDRDPRCPSRDRFVVSPAWWHVGDWVPSSWWSPLDRHWLDANGSTDQSRSGAPTSSNGSPSWDHHCTPPTYAAPSWHHGAGSMLWWCTLLTSALNVSSSWNLNKPFK